MKRSQVSFRVHAFVAISFTATALAFLLFVLHLTNALPSFGDAYRVSAIVPNAGAQLVPGARVTVGGVEAGFVRSVGRRGEGALVKMQLDDTDGLVPIPSDSRVHLRSRTPLGENYISIDWGTSKKPLASGAVLPITQAEDATEVDEILSVLKGKSRDRARQLITSTGEALDGRGAKLNDLVGGIAGAAYRGGNLARALEPDRAKLGQLTAQLGEIARTIGARGDAIDQIAHDALTTFTATAASDVQLRDLLEVLPGTLRQLRRTSGTLTAVSGQAAPVLRKLASVLHDARPTARALRPAANDLSGLVRTLGVAAPKLSTTLRKINRLASPTSRALPQLRRTLCQVDPMLTYLGPYTPDLIDSIVAMESASNAYDAIGHTIRLGVVINDSSLVGLPPTVSAAAKRIVHSGLATLGTSDFNWNPYPKPHSAHAGVTDGKSFLGPDALADGSYFKYPRIEAEC